MGNSCLHYTFFECGLGVTVGRKRKEITARKQGSQGRPVPRGFSGVPVGQSSETVITSINGKGSCKFALLVDSALIAQPTLFRY